MKYKLSCIRSPWRRLLIALLVNSLLIIAGFRSPRSYAHWLGNRSRPPRIERPFFVIVFFGAMLLLETHQYLLWSIIWGVGFSLFVIVDAFLKTFRRIG